MMQISTPDGVEYVSESRDAVDIIRKYISDDLADYVENKIVEFDEVEWRSAQEWASDYYDMEAENEFYRDELWEINSQLQELSVKADEPGFSKKKVIAEIDKMWQRLNEFL